LSSTRLAVLPLAELAELLQLELLDLLSATRYLPQSGQGELVCLVLALLCRLSRELVERLERVGQVMSLPSQVLKELALEELVALIYPSLMQLVVPVEPLPCQALEGFAELVLVKLVLGLALLHLSLR